MEDLIMAVDESYGPLCYRRASGDESVIASGGILILEDNGLLHFGDAADIVGTFNGTNLTLIPAVNDTGSLILGNGTRDMDFKVFMGATDQYVLFDSSAGLVTFAKTDVQINGDLTIDLEDIQLGDGNFLEFGDATGGDVAIDWTGSILEVLPAVDDTGAINIGNGTKDIDLKVFLGTTGKYVDFNVGNANISVTGVPMLFGTQANVVGALALATAQLGALRVFSDDGGVNIADSVRGAQSRTLLTVAQSAGTIRALQGQLRVVSGVNVATGIYTALQGYLELAGAHTSSAGATLSAIDASLECGAVVTATGEVFGVHVECTGAGSLTGAGTCAGIGITTGGTPVWPVGLFIAPLAVTTAISVGTKANLAGSGVVIPSTDDFGAVRIFTDDNGANIADSVRAVQSRTLLTISQSAGTVRALQGQLKALTGVNFDTGVYTPVQGYIELAGTHTVSAAGILSCFDASIEIGTALTATGYVAGFKAELTGSGTCAAGLDCGFLVTNAAGAAVWTHGLYVEAAAADIGIKMPGCGTQALTATVTSVAGGLTGSALCIYASGAPGNQDVGIVAYLDATAFGQSTGNWTYGAGIWLNIDVDFKASAGGWGGHEQISPLSVGVYGPNAIGADIADADIIYGVKAELVGDTTFPTTNGCYFAALNVSQTAATRTAIFFAHQNEAVGLTTAKSTAGGAIALCDINGTMYWVNVYTS
jgi:hypothetical protein